MGHDHGKQHLRSRLPPPLPWLPLRSRETSMDETVKQMGISATLTLPIFPEVGPTTICPLVTIDDPSILESLTAQYKKSFYARLQQQ